MECGFFNLMGMAVFTAVAVQGLLYFRDYYQSLYLPGFNEIKHAKNLAIVIGFFAISVLFLPLQSIWLIELQTVCEQIGWIERYWALFQFFAAHIVLISVIILKNNLPVNKCH